MPALAIANNDIVFLSWAVPARIADCLGFAVFRTDTGTGDEAILPGWVGFKGQTPTGRQERPTTDWPIQKFSWRDLKPRRGHSYIYRIVPMVGAPGKLEPHPDVLTTNPVTVGPDYGGVQAWFNRGILSTQALSPSLNPGFGGLPDPELLRDRIDQPGDPLRRRLAGQAPSALKSFLDRARHDGGDIYLALYELNDVELVHALLEAPFVHVILSNSSKAEGIDDYTNRAARQALREAGRDLTDRMLRSGHIGHNKFAVYVDRHGTPRAVLTGSTNWTATGLCAHSNNILVVESQPVAAAFLDYWHRLKQDDAEQGAALRAFNAANPLRERLEDNTELSVWFSPNTVRRTQPEVAPPLPADLEEVIQRVEQARQALMFLMFSPGENNILAAIRGRQLADPNLFVRGAFSGQADAMRYVDLYHRDGGESDARVVGSAAIPDQFGYWERELYQLGHAVIHDKILVIDPFSDDCAVVTGSHNLGYKASYSNDENLLIIRGNQKLAQAYATHVLDLYDHYRWRYRVQEESRKGRLEHAWSSLDGTDRWQRRYFDPDGLIRREQDFWHLGFQAMETPA